jgi:class 3 adenylate cyclase
MFTDIVGYSAIMSNNEELGLKWLDFYQQQSREVVKRHNGTIIKKMSDGMLMVFNSVLEANYSYLITSAGFVLADLIDCQATVIQASTREPTAVMINIPAPGVMA